MPSKIIEIPGDLMRQYAATEKAEEAARRDAQMRFNALVGPVDDAVADLADLAALKVAVLALRESQGRLRDTIRAWGKEFSFDPKLVYEIDLKHNTVKVTLGAS